VAFYEQGRREPKLAVAAQLAKALGVDLNALAGEDGMPFPSP